MQQACIMLNEDTRPKTLWSQTQFDLLYLALERCKPDIFIKEIMGDLNKRGFPPGDSGDSLPNSERFWGQAILGTVYLIR